MMRFLVPCDGSAQSLRALRHVVRLAEQREPPEIHLLHVREPVDAWQVRGFLHEDEVNRIQQSEGEENLRTARELLDHAGTDYTARVVTGPIAETIAEFATQQGCDHIVMGTHGRGGLATLLLGSVAAKVVYLSTLPVTLVK